MKRVPTVPRIASRLSLLAGGVLAPLSAWAQADTPAPLPLDAAYEPGFMLLAIAAMLVISGLVLRGLLALKLIRRLIWLLPIMIAVTAIFWLFLGLGRFDHFPNLHSLVVFILLFLLFVAMLLPVSRWLLPARVKLTRGGVPPLLRGLAVAVLAFTGLFILLNWSFPTLSFTPLFVTSGVVSIVLGFALQDLLSNLTAGIVLSLERPFKVGDWIRVGTLEGEVVDLSWRATRIRTRDHDHILLPNSLISREAVTNHEQPTPEHLHHVSVGVAYDTPCGAVTAALLDAASKVPELLRVPAPEVHLRDFADSCIVYELRVWIDNFASLPAIDSDVRKHIWYAFKRHGIVIAFPQRDVHVRTVMPAPQTMVPRLVVTAGPLAGGLFTLGTAPLTIGREADCTVVLSDPHISAHHARIEPVADGHRLFDLESRHGTRVNGQLVESADLAPGDEIRIGPLALVYETQAVPAGLPLDTRVKPAPAGRRPSGGRPGDTVV